MLIGVNIFVVVIDACAIVSVSFPTDHELRRILDTQLA
jgi:hypothetical protein